MTKKSAPANAATQEIDDHLPQTSVKPSSKELMQAKLAEFMEKDNQVLTSEPPKEPISPSNEDETWKKRYADLRRHQQKEENTLKYKISSLETQIEQLTQAANQPMPKTREEFEAWKQKFPDVVPFIEMIADEKATMSKKEVTEELDAVKQKLLETEKEKAKAILTRLVPDWETYTVREEFQSWKLTQPKSIQNILDNSEDPQDLARFINICKAEHMSQPIIKKDKLEALEIAVKNTGNSSGPGNNKWKYTQSQIQKMSPQQYTEHEGDIIAARNAGQILDDVSRRNTVFDQ